MIVMRSGSVADGFAAATDQFGNDSIDLLRTKVVQREKAAVVSPLHRQDPPAIHPAVPGGVRR